ncbi:MAG: hypothetical protein AB8B86_11040 [Pseudomonadales bacterium]
MTIELKRGLARSTGSIAERKDSIITVTLLSQVEGLMEYISKYWALVSVRQVVDYHVHGTFDDGYKDVITLALPFLTYHKALVALREQLGLPSAVKKVTFS